MAKPEEGPIRVVVADDHPVVRDGLRRMLEADDIEVAGEASNGLEAVSLVERLKPDVILMDIRMPDMDGLAAMVAMKQHSLKTSVIVLTSYNNMQYLVRSVTCGAAGYFLKGISRDELIASIRAVSAGESLLEVRHLRMVVERLVKEDARTGPNVVSKLHQLTRREREVVNLLVQGLTNKEIASVLGVTPATVKTHVEHLIRKLGVSDRTQAAVWAVRSGIAGL